jgi:ketosteroid isomerase-like protein
MHRSIPIIVRRTLMMPVFTALVTSLIFTSSPAAGRPAAQRVPAKAAAQAEIWAKEQAIYKARGQGDLRAYIDNVAADYRAWPPYSARPTGVAALRTAQPRMAAQNQEILVMEFVDFAYAGDAAVIYYQTHRTRLPNGNPVDERFEVTHSWVWRGGAWKVLGGMARAMPVRPAQ